MRVVGFHTRNVLSFKSLLGAFRKDARQSTIGFSRLECCDISLVDIDKALFDGEMVTIHTHKDAFFGTTLFTADRRFLEQSTSDVAVDELGQRYASPAATKRLSGKSGYQNTPSTPTIVNARNSRINDCGLSESSPLFLRAFERIVDGFLTFRQLCLSSGYQMMARDMK